MSLTIKPVRLWPTQHSKHHDSRGVLRGFVMVFVAIPAIAALFFVDAAWLNERLQPSLFRLALIAAGLFVAVLPLTAFRCSRAFASGVILMVSYLFLATVWIEGLLLTMALWGTFGVVTGLLLGGIGVVPAAILATLLKGMWGPLIELVILVILVVMTRLVAIGRGCEDGLPDKRQTVLHFNWCPDSFDEFRSAALAGRIRLSIMDHTYPWLYDNVLPFGSMIRSILASKSYETKLLEKMVAHEPTFRSVHGRGVDLILLSDAVNESQVDTDQT